MSSKILRLFGPPVTVTDLCTVLLGPCREIGPDTPRESVYSLLVREIL